MPKEVPIDSLVKERGEILYLNPQNVLVGNPGRVGETDVEDLASDMADNGQMQPIGIRSSPEGALLVWGSRRLKGACLINDAKLTSEPFLVACVMAREAEDEAAYFERTLRENVEREDTTPIDDAHNIDELIKKFGRKQDAVAQLYGKSVSWVGQRRKLLSLPGVIRDAVHSGKVAALAAHELTKATAAAQKKVAEQVKKGEPLSFEEALAIVKKNPRNAPRPDGKGGEETPPEKRKVGRPVGSRAKTAKQVKVFFAGLAGYEDAAKDPDGWLADLGKSWVKWSEGKLSDGAMTRKLLEWVSIETAAPAAKTSEKAA